LACAERKWIAEANKSSKTKTANNTQSLPKQADWLDSVNPAVFSRHLHSVIGASWKDDKEYILTSGWTDATGQALRPARFP